MKFSVVSVTADSSCGELSDPLQRNAKHAARLSNISEFSVGWPLSQTEILRFAQYDRL
jgi:hypothetical protein